MWRRCGGSSPLVGTSNASGAGSTLMRPHRVHVRLERRGSTCDGYRASPSSRPCKGARRGSLARMAELVQRHAIDRSRSWRPARVLRGDLARSRARQNDRERRLKIATRWPTRPRASKRSGQRQPDACTSERSRLVDQPVSASWLKGAARMFSGRPVRSSRSHAAVASSPRRSARIRAVLRAHRQDVAALSVEAVADADLRLVHAVEDVELGHAQPGHAVDLDRALERRRVEPAAAARAAGGRAELVAARCAAARRRRPRARSGTGPSRRASCTPW